MTVPQITVKTTDRFEDVATLRSEGAHVILLRNSRTIRIAKAMHRLSEARARDGSLHPHFDDVMNGLANRTFREFKRVGLVANFTTHVPFFSSDATVPHCDRIAGKNYESICTLASQFPTNLLANMPFLRTEFVPPMVYMQTNDGQRQIPVKTISLRKREDIDGFAQLNPAEEGTMVIMNDCGIGYTPAHYGMGAPHRFGLFFGLMRT